MAESITKKILVKEVAQRTGVKMETVRAVWEGFVSEITAHLVEGDKINIDGFGTFEVRDRAERSGRNPHTGEQITVAACKVPALKIGKNLKDAVNGRE